MLRTAYVYVCIKVGFITFAVGSHAGYHLPQGLDVLAELPDLLSVRLFVLHAHWALPGLSRSVERTAGTRSHAD